MKVRIGQVDYNDMRVFYFQVSIEVHFTAYIERTVIIFLGVAATPCNGVIHSASGATDSLSEDNDGNSEHVRFEDDVLMLRNYSFISVSVDTATFEMHRLVQLSMRKWLEANKQLSR